MKNKNLTILKKEDGNFVISDKASSASLHFIVEDDMLLSSLDTLVHQNGEREMAAHLLLVADIKDEFKDAVTEYPEAHSGGDFEQLFIIHIRIPFSSIL